MNNAIVVIRLTGELDIGRRDEIEGALRISGTESAILLDFADVTYADSTALETLLRFRDEAARRAVRIAIVSGSTQFARLIQFAGLTDAFRIFNNRGAALTDLAQASAP